MPTSIICDGKRVPACCRDVCNLHVIQANSPDRHSGIVRGAIPQLAIVIDAP